MTFGGLSKARLARMHDVMAGYVERGEVPGLVTLVSRRGEVHVDAIGTQALSDSTAMRRDTIFRISSMTKPITAVATMILVIDDYLAFGQMMLSKGKYGNERILSRLSVELMTTDQLTPEQKAVSGLFPGFFDSQGWGLGVSVVTRRDDIAAVPGRYGWDGGLGTSWYSDPREEMVIILMTQSAWTSPVPSNVYFWTLAYQAIDD